MAGEAGRIKYAAVRCVRTSIEDAGRESDAVGATR